MRRLVLFVSVVVFVDAMLFGALAPLVPGYADEFGLSKAGAGLLTAAFGAGALLGGIPGGLAAARFGAQRTVIAGLALLALSCFAFAVGADAWSLGLARFVQGISSTVTWAGALTWLTVATPRHRRGELLGTAFGAAVFGAIIGPVFGAAADLAGIRATFTAVGALALVLAAWAATRPTPAREEARPASIAHALRDRRFLGGLWLNTLPALLFGVMIVLVPLELDQAGWTPLAIGVVFLASGLVETAVNPLLGRFSDRRGRLLPIRAALLASVLVATAFAFARQPALLVLLVALAAVSFGGFYTPGMALVSHRAESVGLSQALGFGVMNSAWALGNMTGPAAGGRLADAAGDTLPYLLAAGLCLLTLTVSFARGTVSRSS